MKECETIVDLNDREKIVDGVSSSTSHIFGSISISILYLHVKCFVLYDIGNKIHDYASYAMNNEN